MKKLFLAVGVVVESEYMGARKPVRFTLLVWAEHDLEAENIVRHHYEKNNDANWHSGSTYGVERLEVIEAIGSPE